MGYSFLTNMAMPLTKLLICNNKVQFVNIIVNSLVTMTMNITFIALHHVTQPLSFTRWGAPNLVFGFLFIPHTHSQSMSGLGTGSKDSPFAMFKEKGLTCVSACLFFA